MSGFQLLPPLSEPDYEALREDIKAHGVLSVIDVDENGVILDGHHRQQIATELGIKCPRRVVKGLRSETSKRTYALTINTNRRHLTPEQRRHLTETSLREDPQLVDREHARRIGVSPSSVGAARARLEASGQLPHAETRADSRGHKHKTPVEPLETTDTPTVQLDSNNEGHNPSAEDTATDTGTVPATAAPTEASPAAEAKGAERPDDVPAPVVDPDELESDPLPLPELADPPARPRGDLSDDPDVINEESARRNSHAFASGLAALWMVIEPDPVDWVSRRYRTGTYPQRDLPRVRDVFTAEGLRTLADHLNDIADHLESKGATL